MWRVKVSGADYSLKYPVLLGNTGKGIDGFQKDIDLDIGRSAY